MPEGQTRQSGLDGSRAKLEELLEGVVEVHNMSGMDKFDAFVGNSTQTEVHFGVGFVKVNAEKARALEGALRTQIEEMPELVEVIRRNESYTPVMRLLQKQALILGFLAVGRLLGWWDVYLPNRRPRAAVSPDCPDIFAVMDIISIQNQRFA